MTTTTFNRLATPTDIIDAVAAECANEAARMGSPAKGRGLLDDEHLFDADYDALDEALGRESTVTERRAFRAAFSSAIARC